MVAKEPLMLLHEAEGRTSKGRLLSQQRHQRKELPGRQVWSVGECSVSVLMRSVRRLPRVLTRPPNAAA